MNNVLAKRKSAERQERIDRILAAAGDLFLEKGYTNTTMRDICQASQLSTGAVYFYFKGKDAIYTGICEESFHVLLDLFKASLDGVDDPLERLEAINRAYVEFYSKYNERWLLMSTFRTVGLSQVLFERLEKLDFQVIGMASAAVADFLEGKGLADKYTVQQITLAVWAGTEGLMDLHQRKYFTYMNTTLEEMVDLQFQVFLKGLGE
jgi:AcrR family transcriptional regulator